MLRFLTSVGFLLLTPAVLGQEPVKQSSGLYPPAVVARVRANVEQNPWAASIRDQIVEAAESWRAMSDDELWGLMYGSTLPRSWMVWSNGHSPATGDPVPMYNWIMDALAHPWKVKCPHSGELFPKNDFKAFYDSGLDARGIFDPTRADRSLLFNTDHPDPDDPLHRYGVDDGDGYVNEKGEQWLFVGAYLIYGQWKQAVLGGIRNLSAAYLLTGDPIYARKAAIILDRVADLYPSFDFGEQGILYEGPGAAGYVSTWHDACEETRELAQAYDMVFEAIREDNQLVAFLSGKAREHGLENRKASFAEVQRNIEGRILRDALTNAHKVRSNYPRTEILKAIILKVLQAPEAEFWQIVDPMLDRATAVDGVTGEKGLAGYSSFTIAGMAMFLAECAKADPEFLAQALLRQPRLRQAYRFHIDTYCLGRFYPLSGDTGQFAGPMPNYVGMYFLRPGAGGRYGGSWTVLPPSSYRLLWDLYQGTGDAAFVQTLYRANDSQLDGLPYDVFGSDPAAFQTQVAAVLDREGAEVSLASVNKEEWNLAILRSGDGDHARALWLDYDSGGGHGHQDGLNLGLFAHGLDLLPDMGYPPVQFGGWGSPRAVWYKMSAAHNTVVVDGRNHDRGDGKTTLWADGRYLHAVRADAPALNGGQRFERTAVMVDVSERVFYVVDVFRVAGGTEHTKFVHSHFGDVEVQGLSLEPAKPYGHKTQMRNFQMDAEAEAGWNVDWRVEDRYGLLPEDSKVGFRYTDFTMGAEAGLAEGWIVAGSFDASEEVWIPRVFVRHGASKGSPHHTTFVSLYEPYDGDQPRLRGRRIALSEAMGTRDRHVALEITLPDGGRDVLILRDSTEPADTALRLETPKPTVTDGELVLIRTTKAGAVRYVALAHGAKLNVDGTEFGTGQSTSFFESEY